MSTIVGCPQRLEALEQANRVRIARGHMKRAIAAGELGAAEVIAPGRAIPWEARSMSVFELLKAQHRWGADRVRGTLIRLAIGERRRLDALTERQRRCLTVALAASGAPPRTPRRGSGSEPKRRRAATAPGAASGAI